MSNLAGIQKESALMLYDVYRWYEGCDEWLYWGRHSKEEIERLQQQFDTEVIEFMGW